MNTVSVFIKNKFYILKIKFRGRDGKYSRGESSSGRIFRGVSTVRKSRNVSYSINNLILLIQKSVERNLRNSPYAANCLVVRES